MGIGRMVACVGVLALGCSAAEDPVQPDNEGFELVAHDETTIEAVVHSTGEELRLIVTEASEGVLDVTFDFGDPVIAFRLDHNTGVGDFMPTGALTAVHQRLLDEMYVGVANAIAVPNTEQTLIESTAIRQIDLMRIVPTGEVLRAGTFKSARGWTHISCSCGNQYIGSGYTRKCGKGCGCGNSPANGCAGRCGQGCGGTSTPSCSGSTVYTRDCAKHDYGLGSWWAASDDYAFASNNCSCGGNCY